MATIKFQSGQTVNFNGNPTPDDIDFVAKKLGIKPDSTPSNQINQKPKEAEGGVGGLAGGLIGFAKNVIDVPRKVADLGSYVGQKASDAVFGETGPSQAKAAIKMGTQRPDLTTPHGGAEKFGAGLEQVAEFLLPVPGIGKAKAVAELVEKAPLLARLGKGAVSLGKEAADVAARSAIQKGTTEDLVKDAEAGAVGGLATRGLLGAGSLLKRGAESASGKLIGSLIKPRLKDLAYGKNPVQGVLKEGITANSLEELGQKLSSKREEIGQQIGEKVKGAGGKVDAKNLLKPLEQEIQTAKKMPGVNAPIIARLETTMSDLKGLIGKKRTLNPQELFEFKKAVADVTRFTGNESDDRIVNAALKQTYGATKDSLNKLVNGLDDLNERYANVTSAELASKSRDIVEQRRNLVSIPGAVGGAAATATILASGGSAIPAMLLGAGASQIDKVLGTPAVKTRVAQWLSKASAQERNAVLANPQVKAALERAFGTLLISPTR